MKLLILSLLLSLSVTAKTIVLTEANSISINQPITSGFLAHKLSEVLAKSLAGKDLYLILNTPGGEVMSGSLFMDILKGLPVRVHTITIFAASMGYQFVQNLNGRYILPSGVLMSHRAAVGGVSGQINGELNSRVKFFTDISNRLDIIAAERSSQSLASYQASIVNELWLTSQAAVDSKHADEVVSAVCDKELSSGTKTELVDTQMFGSLKVTFSKCPLVTAPLKVEASDYKARSRVFDYYRDISKFVRGERL
jgi:ATP-dependent protease ClpP protease subunit